MTAYKQYDYMAILISALNNEQKKAALFSNSRLNTGHKNIYF